MLGGGIFFVYLSKLKIMDNLFIIVLKDRINFLTQQLPKDEFTLLEYEDDNFFKVVFNKIDSFTLLNLFHAGIRCGNKL